MASLSALRSPSALSHHHLQNHHHQQQQHHHQLVQSNGGFSISPSPSSPVVVGHNLFLQPQYQHQHQYSSACCPGPPEKVDEAGEKRRSDGGSGPAGPLYLENPGFRRNTFYFDSDCSSPTSWEFRDNCRLHRPSHLFPSRGSLTLSGAQMPAASHSSSPVVLPLPLPSRSRGSSSANSSLSTTPSPLDELGPGSHPYQVQMQLSLLGQADRCHSVIPLSTSGSGKGLQNCGRMVVSSNSSESNCACVFVSSPNHHSHHSHNGTMLVASVGGGVSMDIGGVANDTAPLHLHELTNNGSGSDGSRNSTGSHRSQDSGFSDSGETRRRKSSLASMHTASVNNEAFHHLQTSTPHVLNGSGGGHHHLHHNQNSINACPPCQADEQGQQPVSPFFPREYECAVSRTNCCGDRLVTSSSSSPAPLVPNGQALHHPQHIYDCIPSSMPSPILPSGFGCGRLPSNGSSTPQHHTYHHPHPLYGVVVSNTPPARPTSVDISTLDRNGNCNGLSVLSRMSPLPSPVSPTTTCSNCLPSSISVPNVIPAPPPPPSQRRSFSPSASSSRLIHHYPSHSHDISALASSSTATAIAALQVPLSSSTPKRGSSLPSSRLGNSGHGVNMVLKIDNFESLNKNVNVNKDNNNNSSGGGTGSGVSNAKTGNKTFTIQQLATSNNSSTSSPHGGSQVNHTARHGTVLAEEEQKSGQSRADSGAVQESAPAFKRTRSAAESIYDKICSRLSSFSSSTSSAASPSISGSPDETQIATKKCNGTPYLRGTKLSVCESEVGGSDSVINCEGDSSQSKSSSNRSNCSNEDSRLSSGSTSRFRLFTRTSSAKWQSLPRGVSPQQLSLVEEEQSRRSLCITPVGECENMAVISSSELSEKKTDIPKPENPRRTTAEAVSTPLYRSNPWNLVEEKTDSQVVRLWLHDLRTQTEPECLHSLQTKWIVPAELGEEEDEEDEGTEILSRESSQSPATSSSTLASNSNTTTTATTADQRSSSTEEQSGRISCSSASSTSHHPLTSTSPTDMDTGTLSSSHSERNYRGHNPSLIPPVPTRSNLKSLIPHPQQQQQHQRRSQQKFLSSMTAAIHAVSTPLMSIRNVEMTANIISGEFSKICKHMEFGVFTQVPTLVLSLVGHIEDFLRGIQVPVVRGMEGAGVGFNIHLKKLEARLENGCYALDMAAKAMSDAAIVTNASDSSGGGGGGGSDGNSSTSTGYPHRHPPQPPPRSSSTSPLSSQSSSSSSNGPVPSSSRKTGGAGDDPLVLSSSSSSDPEPESLDRQYHVVVGEVVEGIVTVGNLFSQVVDLRLTRDLASILDTVEGGGIPARIALKSLATVLADGGNHICRLAADIRTVRGLLGVLLDTREDQDKILALRCLATVLCVGEAVKDFDKAGGFEIVADILYDPIYSLWMKIEAVAVLTQATDPWIDLETTLITLGVHLQKFMVSLTSLIGEFKTEEEPFLLIVAAISNLTFLEVASTEYLKKCRTVSFLINAVKKNPGFSVFVLDHVATILANMAGVESCRQEIIHCGGIDALLQFLQQRPCLPGKTDTASAITACERLQQKSTIAISRLANEDGVARYIFNMGGVHRLVSLCRKEKERNYSDGVLIAALATLRKLVTICGEEALKRLAGAEDLIEPRLLDSFLLYSSRQESYV